MEGGRAGQVRQWRMATKTTELERTPRTPKPILPALCEKTFFCFIHSSASGNHTFKILHLLHQYITGETYFKSIKPYSMIGHLLINYEMYVECM